MKTICHIFCALLYTCLLAAQPLADVSPANPDTSQEFMLNRFKKELQDDLIQLDKLILLNKSKNEKLRAFTELRHSDLQDDSELARFYAEWKPMKIWAAHVLRPHDFWLNQLKDSGSLSYMDETTAGKIASYDYQLRGLSLLTENYKKRAHGNLLMMYELSDYKSLWNDPPVNSHILQDEKFITKYFNYVADLMWVVIEYNEHLEALRVQMNEMIASLDE